MSERESQAEEPKPSERRSDSGSVFGNLPKQRPGSRSPRRSPDASGGNAAKAPTTKAGKRPAPPRRGRPPAAERQPGSRSDATGEPIPPKAEAPPAGQRPDHQQEASGGIEDLAWAGVTVAAQAATVGVKFASRALEAVRKSVERP